MHDAVVIGAGHNGLVAANLLADAGWDVVVVEGQPEPGGAVRSAEHVRPGFVHDLFSAFYPLAAASPVMRSLDLGAHGLQWVHAPFVVAHPDGDGGCAVLSRDLDETAASLDAFAPGDGDAWRQLSHQWEKVSGPFLDAMLGPFPPVRAGARLAWRLKASGLLRLARTAVVSVRRMGEENFQGEGGRRLLAGNALHADLPPEGAGSGLFGWLLAGLGQQYGFPVPKGGAGEIIAALVRRLEATGRGTLLTGTPVERVVVRGGRAVAVRTAAGDEIPARRAVLADVGAPALLLELVGVEHLPPRVVDDMARFQYDNATVKVDWALDGPVPWDAEPARRAGTVHVGDTVDDLSRFMNQLARGLLPDRPYLVVGQMSVADPTRSPPGTESLWAYTHVPQMVRGDAADQLKGTWDWSEAERFADRMETEIERVAPGFGDRISGRYVWTPPGLEAANPNLVGGAINGGTAQFHQQLVFRPIPGLARPAMPVKGLFLASASAHPGGGVHGGPGANAARAALKSGRRSRLRGPGRGTT